METVYKHLVRRFVNPNDPWVIVDEDNRVATFLMYNLSGQIVGYQQYRPDADKTQRNDEDKGRYYTYVGPEGNGKKIGVYGVHTMNRIRGGLWNKPLYLTEGIFDAAVLHHHDLPAISVQSNDPKYLRPWLRALSVPTVAICDGDKAGERLAKIADMAFHCPKGHDLSSLYEDWDRGSEWLAGRVAMAQIAFR